MILLKDTSYVSIIGLADILRQTGVAVKVTKQAFLFYTRRLRSLSRRLPSSPPSASATSSGGPSARRSADEPRADAHSAAAGAEPSRTSRSPPTRITGYVVVALWMRPCRRPDLRWSSSGWDPTKFTHYGPRYLHGLLTTIVLVAISVVFGADPVVAAGLRPHVEEHGSSMASPIATSTSSAARRCWPSSFSFTTASAASARSWKLSACGGSSATPGTAACSAMTINTAAYQAEILRGAIESVPRGQHEARSLARPPQDHRLPQDHPAASADRRPAPYGNEIILLIKGSAIVAIITVLDLMGETRYAFSRTFDYQTYLWAAIFYLAMVEALRHLWNWIERRLTRHLKR